MIISHSCFHTWQFWFWKICQIIILEKFCKKDYLSTYWDVLEKWLFDSRNKYVIKIIKFRNKL